MSLEVELPAAYLDALVEDTSASGLQLINAFPEPGETGVPRDSLVSLEVAALGAADTIVTASTTVTINGVVAFTLGAFQPGFAGADSSSSTPQTDVHRLVIDYQGVFESQSDVVVEVSAATSTGETRVFTYAFRTVDATAPQLLSAVALAARTLRLRWNEAIDPASVSTATWSVLYQTAPAVALEVVSATWASPLECDLTLSVEMTPRALYLITATGVTDVLGNPTLAPFNTASVLGFAPPWPADRDFDFYRMLPQVSREADTTQDLLKFIACLQEVGNLLLSDIDRFADQFDPELASEEVLDLMLRDLGNPFAFDLTAKEKLRLLLVLVDMYGTKGTAAGIKNVVRFFLGLEVEIDSYNVDTNTLVLGESELGLDWTLGTDVSELLYSFRIVVAQVLTDAQRDGIRAIAEYMKPAHTHLVSIDEPPPIPPLPDHLELGLSELGDEWVLH